MWCTFRQRSRRARTGACSCNGGREQRRLDWWSSTRSLEPRQSENVLDSAGDRVDALGKSGKLGQGCAERVQTVGGRHEDTSKLHSGKGNKGSNHNHKRRFCAVQRAASQHDHKVGAPERPSPAVAAPECNSTPTAHTFFSCTVCQRACPSLLSQLYSHLVTDFTHCPHASRVAQESRSTLSVSFHQNSHTSSRNVICNTSLNDTEHGHSFLTCSASTSQRA